MMASSAAGGISGGHLLGEHTDEVLRELLDMSAAEIDPRAVAAV